jgi:hypothetical protein
MHKIFKIDLFNWFIYKIVIIIILLFPIKNNVISMRKLIFFLLIYFN